MSAPSSQPQPGQQAPSGQTAPSGQQAPAPGQSAPSSQGAPPPAPTQSPYPDPNQLYADFMKGDEQSWQQRQGQLQNQMGGMQRRAAINSVRAGMSFGGGGANSLAGAAMGRGVQAFNEAELAHRDRKNNFLLGWIDRQDKDRRRQEEESWVSRRVQDDQAFELFKLGITSGGQTPSPEVTKILTSGKPWPEIQKDIAAWEASKSDGGGGDDPAPAVDLQVKATPMGSPDISTVSGPNGTYSLTWQQKQDFLDALNRAAGAKLSPAQQQAALEEELRSMYWNGGGGAGPGTIINYLVRTGWM